ncbi:MAG: GNAT family N-acetyltransferase [Chloroflexota bacterium]|nr:GNAT family N-acetyltransferase [Chloroflexota bacterium]
MTGKQLFTDEIHFQPAKPSDGTLASRLLFETFSKKATFIIGLGDERRAKKILSEIFAITGHRLSFEFAQIAMYEERAAGMVIAFPGKMIGKLNRRLNKLILREYSFRGKLAFILRVWPLVFLKETSRDEFFLSNLVVRKKYRGRGIAEKIILHVEAQAKGAGFSKLALMVDLDNQVAKGFYDQHGYAVKAINLESNSRSPYVGPGYQRRVKDLSL